MEKEKVSEEMMGPPSEFTVKSIDLETGELTVVMNREDAQVLGIRSLDRVKVTSERK